MIVSHPLLNININPESINVTAEREGYDLFIPVTFVKHLMAAFSFVRMGQSYRACIVENNDYTKEFLKLMNIINFRDAKTDDPLVFAIRVLKLFANKLDYRQLENTSISGVTFSVDTKKSYQNYSFDLRSLSEIQIKTLGLQDKDLDTIELDEEVKKLLIFYDGLSAVERFIDPEYDIIKKQITSYSDFYKGRHYKLALPSFPVDLGMKKLQITKIDDKEVLASEVIIMMDCSLSMVSIPFSRAMFRSVLLYYINQLDSNKNLTITIAEVIGTISNIRKITKSEELQAIFYNLPKFILPIRTIDNVFKDIELRYAGKSVVFLTDGRLNLLEPMHLKYKLYCIGLTYNEVLKQTCQLSGGQFIVLK